jgi:hypothetical protein
MKTNFSLEENPFLFNTFEFPLQLQNMLTIKVPQCEPKYLKVNSRKQARLEDFKH